MIEDHIKKVPNEFDPLQKLHIIKTLSITFLIKRYASLV